VAVSTGTVLVVDVGTSGVRVSTVGEGGAVSALAHAAAPPSSPADGLVELDATRLAATVVDLAAAALERAAGPIAGIAITNQRATAVVWEAASGRPVGPAIGWQDLRTVGRCLELRAEGVRLAPNQSATKFEWLVRAHGSPDGAGLCAGTIDAFLVWTLTAGAALVTDATNAGVTGLATALVDGWDTAVLEALGCSALVLPEIAASVGPLGEATVLPGRPPILALVGDQQASLVGQGGVVPGVAKITFGTGGMLDVATGTDPPASERGPRGTFPIVAWRDRNRTVWGVEAAMLTAGSAVAWLQDGLGVLGAVDDAAAVAARCDDTGGVVFVPALAGLGTPWWDFGARGTLLGLTRGTGRAELVRAVLEGVAHRGVDLVEAAEADTGRAIGEIRVDGGMTRNGVFLQALADAGGRPVAVSREPEATTLGAGLLGLVAAGSVGSVADLAELGRPGGTVEPSGRPDGRARWLEAIDRARGWIPELGAISF
jgi:glycerol kinase